jgi:hypothetical protein
MITIRFSDFWKNSHSVKEKFFSPLISEVYGESVQITNNPDVKVDLEIFSVFPKKPTIAYRALRRYGIVNEPLVNPLESRVTANAHRKIWFTGENVKPPIPDMFDAYLSFESAEYHSKNIYLPLWVLNINWFGQSGAHGFTSLNPTQDELLLPKDPDSIRIEAKEGCCAFIGVMENTRRNALYEIDKLMKTDIYGASVGKQISDKVEVAHKYRFILAFENSISSGYVTEKLLEAQLTNAFPLYWGPKKVEYFNPDRFINFSDFCGIDDFVAEIQRLNGSSEELVYRLSQPAMLRRFELDSVVNRLRQLIL